MLAFAVLGTLYAFQQPFRQYPGQEYATFDLPPDWQVKAEWIFARLMYPPHPSIGLFRTRGPWQTGWASWTNDYPRADRHFTVAMRRLTRLDVRSVEQPVNLDDGDDVYNYPWLYAVQAGSFDLTDAQAAFHTVFDLEKTPIPGEWSLRSGRPYRNDGVDPHWRGISDEKGRLMVAIWFNIDAGDSWEWADWPEYPEHYSALGIRMGINFILYSMTH